MNKTDKDKLRYNMLNLLIYSIGIVLVVRLFDFQIVHGKEYRQLSNNRLTREVTISPTRGNIVDRTGNVLVGNTMGFELQLYKSKIETEQLNETILKIVNILEKNGDTYIDTFPIKVNPIEYTYSGETLTNWQNNNNVKNMSAEEVLYVFKDKYKISNDDITEVRKIISIRYRIETEHYSSTNPLLISKNISRLSMLEINEKGNELSGIEIITKSIRDYRNRNSCISYFRLYGKNK